MDEQALAVQRCIAKIGAIDVAGRIEVQMPHRGHDDPPWLEKGPFAVPDLHRVIVDGFTKDATREPAFALCQPPGAIAGQCP